MDWLAKILETVTGGLPGAAIALCPDHLKKEWLERLADHNPFKTISANHDLVRATRLAWIEAAQEVLKEGLTRAGQDGAAAEVAYVERFDAAIAKPLQDARAHALDRRRDPGASPIDAHVQAVIAGVPELVSPGDHGGMGAGVTALLTATLAGLSGWKETEIPALYQQIADDGLATHGGGPKRRFGELVFAAFAEIIKDPKKYPQAREAFYIAMDKLGRDTANEKLDELLRRTAQAQDVPLDALRAILTDMGERADMLDAGQVEEKLKAKAAEFKLLIERLNRLSNDDPEVSRLRKAAAEALDAGRFVQADAHLAAAEASDLGGLEDLEVLAKHKRLSAAESRAERAAAAKLRTNPSGYREAASHFGEAARIAQAADPEVSRGYKDQEGLVLIDLGREFGLNGALVEAIEHFRALLLSTNRRADPLRWAGTQNKLGVALSILGERESGPSRLEEAVAAYRAALEEGTRDRVPLDWASTQNNLGNVLTSLGARESGTARLGQAVAAYRAALEERTRERVPLDWAMTQNNLGTALAKLGEREIGTSRLRKAVAAFRAALEERTRERVPLQWAMTQDNLGAALATLGEREEGTSQLEEALVAHRAALEERRRERVPIEWAMTYGKEGDVLRIIAERTGDLVLAEKAIRQIEAALEIVSAADHAPLAAYYAEQAARARALIAKLRAGG